AARLFCVLPGSDRRSRLFPCTTLFRSGCITIRSSRCRFAARLNSGVRAQVRHLRWPGDQDLFNLTCSTSGKLSTFVTPDNVFTRSEEHTSELQSRENLVCRLLLEKKKK